MKDPIVIFKEIVDTINYFIRKVMIMKITKRGLRRKIEELKIINKLQEAHIEMLREEIRLLKKEKSITK